MSVPWIVLVVNDLRAYLLSAQYSALQTAALGVAQGNPFDEIMPAVVARVRNEIQGCKSNIVSATANSIPPELKSETCYLILEQMATRIPSLKFTEQQAKAADEARKLLSRISKCEVPVTIPPDPLVPPQVQAVGEIEVITTSSFAFSESRRATRERLNGL